MNKRQIKKRYKRINGTNPPKSFTIRQMKKCSKNNILSNKLCIFACIAGNAIKGLSESIAKIAESMRIVASQIRLDDNIEEAHHE